MRPPSRTRRPSSRLLLLLLSTLLVTSAAAATLAPALAKSAPRSTETAAPTTLASTLPLQLSAGNMFMCMVLSDDSVSCTGSNTYGNLGFGGTVNSATPMRVAEGDFRARYVSAGMTHTCAIATSGYAWCWGSAASGESGNNPDKFSEGYTSDPVQVTRSTGLGKVSTLCAGMYFTLAVSAETGALWGWGSNLYGVLGAQPGSLPYGSYSYEPTEIKGFPDGTHVVEVACGQTHACYLTTTGTVGCHGFSNFGQIPTAGLGLSLTPVWVPSFTAQSLSAGAWHTCAVDTAGAVWCAGSSASFQAGGPTRIVHTKLTQVPGFPDGFTAVKVVAGEAFTLVVDASSNVFVFGSTSNGQAATGAVNTAIATPERYADGAQVLLVTAGVTHSAYVDPTGQTWAAGLNVQGELGTGAFGKQFPHPQKSLLALPRARGAQRVGRAQPFGHAGAARARQARGQGHWRQKEEQGER